MKVSKEHLAFMVVAALLTGCGAAPSRPTAPVAPIAIPGGVMSVHNAAIASARSIATGGAADLRVMNEQGLMERAKVVIADQLRDPGSAQFRSLRVASYAGGVLVCGEVNAKNSFGGYAGFVRFIANASKGDIDRQSLGASAGIVDACGI
ncbi:MAG: hypothetical protein KIT86_08880 [Hydrogenophaga sp.]|nr:hypothetical protein [Hydrogenophaga sp.]